LVFLLCLDGSGERESRSGHTRSRHTAERPKRKIPTHFLIWNRNLAIPPDWISTRSRRQKGKVLHALHTPRILETLSLRIQHIREICGAKPEPFTMIAHIPEGPDTRPRSPASAQLGATMMCLPSRTNTSRLSHQRDGLLTGWGESLGEARRENERVHGSAKSSAVAHARVSAIEAPEAPVLGSCFGKSARGRGRRRRRRIR
jgi:hypothetical protein